MTIPFYPGNRTLSALLLSCAFITSNGSSQVVFSESFESPVVSGFDDNTVPDNGNWIGTGQGVDGGFGATNRGLYNETFAWPDTAPFTTPYGEQAYMLNGPNNGLTTSVGATGQTITADVEYTVSVNVAALVGAASTEYSVELVAFDVADDNIERADIRGVGGGAGTPRATATGTVTTSDFSEVVTLSYTPDATADAAYLGMELGIRFKKPGGSVLYDNVRLIVSHDFAPTPESGVIVPAGNVNLSWTNKTANVGSDVWVDVYFGTDPGSMVKVEDAQLNLTTTTVSAAVGDTYYWRIDSYLGGVPTGTPDEGDVFVFIVNDTDGDGFTDDYETTYSGTTTGLNPGDDLENGGLGDGLTNAQELFYGTDPTDPDTDGDTLEDGPELSGVGARPVTSPVEFDTDDDGLSDGVESNTGTWVSSADTGTDPTDSDCDDDGIKDGNETNTGVYVDRFDTGSDPFNPNTDGDNAGDFYEANASFTDPSDINDAPSVPYPLPDPDGSTGATDKPVKVYIMAGQSNMVGIGYVTGVNSPGSLEAITKVDGKFPNIIDGSNNWTQRQDVMYHGVGSADGNNGPLTAGQGADDGLRVGPELGFGHVMGYYHDEPVLLIKASEGNRSLAWDFCPPSSVQWEGLRNGSIHTIAGYGDSPSYWITANPKPDPIWYYAGKQYDDCFRNEDDMGRLVGWVDATAYSNANKYLVKHNGVMYECLVSHTSDSTTEPGVGANWQTVWGLYSIFNTHDVLENFDTLYPQWAAQGYEIAGFVWWQGHKDQSTTPYHEQYEANMVNLINDLRSDFSAPNAPFVLGTIGFGGGTLVGKSTPFTTVYNAQVAVGDPVQHPEFAGTVKTVDTLPYWRELDESPGSQDFHYNNNAETYTLVGDALARAMIDILETDNPPFPNPMSFEIEPTAVDPTSIGMRATVANDPIGPIEYYFENITEGTNSGWVTDRTWIEVVPVGGPYDYRVKARDGNLNETDWSPTVSASPGSDVSAPTPDPMTFAVEPTTLGESSITMTASTASDINGVEYYFECVTDNTFDSVWQADPSYVAVGLAHSTLYEFRVKARDLSAGNNETAYSGSFGDTTDTPDLIDPTVNSLSPADDSVDVSIGTDLVVTFDESISIGTGFITIKNLTDLTQDQIDITDGTQVSNSGAVLTINPTANLLEGKSYAIQIDATAIDDLVGNSFAGILDDTTWNFSTPAPDLTAPLVSTFNPADETTNVDIATDLIVTFDEDVYAGAGFITIENITDGVDTLVDVTDGTQVSISGNILTINLTSDLLYEKDYAIQIPGTAIQDGSGNAYLGIADSTTWNFTTESAPPPGLVFEDDFEVASGSPDVSGGYDLANTSQQVSSKWVRANNNAFGSNRNGIVHENENSGTNFTDPVGSQAYAFRYTNSGVTTSYQQIGPLTAGTTYTVTFDVFIDGNNGGDSYEVGLVTFNGAGTRNFVSSLSDDTSSVLASQSGTAASGSYVQKTLMYTADGTESSIGHDVAVRFDGATSAANIDNVQVVTSIIADETDPLISTLSPADDSTDVAIASDLVVTFDEAIAAGTGLITIKNLDAPSQLTIDITDGTQVSISGGTLTINPTADLLEGTNYAIQIADTAVDDLSGNSFAGILDDTTWNFSTVDPDVTNPTVSTLDPADDSIDVAVDSDLVVTFDETISIGTGLITIKNLDATSEITIDITDGTQVSNSGAILTINPTADLLEGTNYAIQIADTAIDDLAGNSFAGILDDTTWNFSTVNPDVTAPLVDTLSPSNGAVNVPVANNLVVTFDEDVAIGGGFITVKNLTDVSQVQIDVTDGSQVSVSGAVLTVDPTSDLLENKDYAIQIDASAIQDLSGNAFVGILDDSTWAFTTAGAPVIADALIYEPFDQAAGSLNGADGGTGLSGQWSTNNTVTVEAAGSLSYGTLTNTGGQARVVHSAGTDAYVEISSVLTDNSLLADGATLWFSYLLRKDTGNGTNEKGGFAFGTDRLDGAYNGTNMINSGNGLGVISINNSVRPASWSGGGNGSGGSGSIGFTYGDTVLVVGEIVWGADGAADEQITIYTPSLADLSSMGAGESKSLSAVDQSLFDTISFTQRNSGNTDQFYDEIRFGATYESVVGLGGGGGGDTTAPTVSTLSPADEAGDVAVDSDLVVTFDEDIAAGGGFITLKNISDASQVQIDVTDGSQVSISGAVLTINPTSDMLSGKNYAVQIDASAIEDLAGNTFVGILDDTTWNFATAAPVNDYANWISGYDVGAETGFDQDPDGDNLGSGLENFLNKDPSVSDPGVFSELAKDGNTFTFVHPENPNPAIDMTITYQWSTNLVDFYNNGQSDGSTTVTFVPTINTPAAGQTTVVATATGGVPEGLFVRINVTQDSP